MPIPNPLVFTAFDVLTASEMNDLIENDEALADGSAIDDGAIKPQNLLAGTGSTWGWTSYTPTWTNLTVGSGTNVGYYKQIGKTVFIQIHWVFGSGASVGVEPEFSLPVTASSHYSLSGTFTPIVNGLILDSGTANLPALGTLVTTGRVRVGAIRADTTYAAINYVGTTTPMTWTTADEIRLSGFYEAA